MQHQLYIEETFECLKYFLPCFSLLQTSINRKLSDTEQEIYKERKIGTISIRGWIVKLLSF